MYETRSQNGQVIKVIKLEAINHKMENKENKRKGWCLMVSHETDHCANLYEPCHQNGGHVFVGDLLLVHSSVCLE